jgi:hypothetical protein
VKVDGVTKYNGYPEMHKALKDMRGYRLSINRHEDSGTVGRKWTKLSGFGFDLNLGVNNNDVDTALAAIVERLFFVKLNNGDYKRSLDVKHSVISKRMKKFYTSFTKRCFKALPVNHKQFCEMYKGPLKRRYERACEELLHNDVTVKDSFVKFFVKFEKTNVSKAPRVISPRDPKYNVELGKFLKPVEKRIYKTISKVFREDNVVLKGMNVTEIANELKKKFHGFSDPVAVGADAKKFDMHVDRGMLMYEHQFYKYIFNNDPELVKLLNWQLRTKANGYFQDGNIKFQMPGKRSSGDMNTGLGNCIIMCAMVWSFANERNFRVKLANNGDDCVLFLEKRDLHHLDHFPRFCEEMGFRMEMEEPVYEFEQIEFCQMHPLYTDEGVTMCRNWKTALTKDTMCIKNLPLNQIRNWFAAVGLCGLKTYGGLPILSTMYKKMISLSSDRMTALKDKDFHTWNSIVFGRGMDRSDNVISTEARVSFYVAFGITPQEQIEMERVISSREIELEYKNNPIDFLANEISW